jgi:hypothetical protein
MVNRTKPFGRLVCIPRPTRTQASRYGNTFAFGYCIDFKVGPGRRDKPGAAQTVPPQSSHILTTANLNPTIKCNCGACEVPPDRAQGYRTSNFFRTNCRSGRA